MICIYHTGLRSICETLSTYINILYTCLSNCNTEKDVLDIVPTLKKWLIGEFLAIVRNLGGKKMFNNKFIFMIISTPFDKLLQTFPEIMLPTHGVETFLSFFLSFFLSYFLFYEPGLARFSSYWVCFKTICQKVKPRNQKISEKISRISINSNLLFCEKLEKLKYIVGCRGASQLGGSLLEILPRV